MVASWFFFSGRNELHDTFTDPELAYAETMRILAGVSEKFNMGTKTLEPVSKINIMTTRSFEAIGKSTKIVEENLKTITQLSETIDSLKLPVKKNTNK